MSRLSRARAHLTYANVMATVAVFLALGGVGYAATALPRNSVGPKQLRANAVTSGKVSNRTLKRIDFATKELAALTGKQGAAGAQGATGPQGPKGDAGPPGPTAGRFVSRNNVGTALAASFAKVMDLASLHDEAGDHQITVGFTARITVSGSVEVANMAASANSARCDVQISNGTGPENGYATMHNPGGLSLSTPAVINYAIGLPLSGSVVKPPGTYNIRVYCAAGGMRFDAANLAVTAVAA
jgi:hypothetical protein